eukprot:2611180-Ditylum_brightwellii.AAC.1
MLGSLERMIANRGYKGEAKIRHPDWGTAAQRKAMGKARARHEMVNGRLKNWQAMKQVFHHQSKHHFVFCAVLAIEQTKIMNGQPPFQVEKVDDPALQWE